MQLTQTQKIIISVFVLAVLLGGFAFFIHKNKTSTTATNTSTASTTITQTGKGGIVTTGTGGYTIEQVPVTGATATPPKPIPDLTRLVFAQGISVDAKNVATQNIQKYQMLLKKNPLDWSSWINLGIAQKMAGDYLGTSISWQYAAKIAPTDYISLGDLADLYAHFLNDNVQAEVYYKLAVKNGPTQSNSYTQFAEFYRDNLNNIAQAKAIVDQGLAHIPNDQVLLQLQASLNK